MTRKEKVREYTRQWASRNKDVIREKNARYREANREKLRVYQRAWRAKMTDEQKAKQRENLRIWREKHVAYSPERGPRKPYVKKPKIEVPRLPPIQFSMTLSCSFCECKVRRGTPEYYDGEFMIGEFTCSSCMEKLKAEA